MLLRFTFVCYSRPRRRVITDVSKEHYRHLQVRSRNVGIRLPIDTEPCPRRTESSRKVLFYVRIYVGNTEIDVSTKV
jgi:hypothetical protein